MRKATRIGRSAIALAVAAALATPAALHGALNWDPTNTLTTNGGGPGAWDAGSTNWFDPANPGAPVAWDSSVAIFGGTAGTGLITIEAAGVSAAGVTFNSTGYTIGGGTLSLTGTSTLNVSNAANSAVINAIIAGTPTSVTIGGPGTLTLGGANTYTGQTLITGGTVTLTNDSALGLSGAGNETLLSSGAALQISGSGLNIAEFLSLSGTGTTTGGALRNLANSNTVSGAITLTGATLISSDAGTLTLSGGISATDQNLTFGGAGNVTVSAAIATGSGTLTKSGSGTLILSGANTYTGATTISGGTLQFNIAGSIGGTGATVTVAAGSTAAAGFAMDQAFLGRINSASAGVLALAVDSSNNLDFSAAGANLPTVSLGAVGTATYSGTLIPNGTTYRLGGGGGTLVFNSVLTGANNLTVGLNGTAASTVSLATANTFTGGVTMNSGTLQVANAGAINGNAVTFGSASTGILQLNGNGITIGGLSTNATVGTPVVENANATAALLTVNPAATQTFAGVLRDGTGGGALSLTKTGSSTLTISGANTYTGVTNISAGGVLAIASATALGTTAGNTIVANGAALQVSGVITVAEPLSLTGGGLSSAGALRKTANNATTWSGAITLGTGGARINSDSNTFTVSGGISGTAQPLTVGGAGNTTISGLIATGSGGTITKDGTGTLTLGNGSNSFSAPTTSSVVITVTAGTLVHAGESSGAAGAVSSTGLIPASVTPSYVLLNGGTFTSTRAGVGVTFLAANKGVTLGSNGGTFGVTDVTAGNLNIYAGVVAGTGALSYIGPGILSLTNDWTYTGATSVTGGILRLRSPSVGASLWLPQGTDLTVGSGGTFDMANLSQTIGSLAGSGSVVATSTSTATLTIGGPTATPNNNSTTFSGVIQSTAAGTTTLLLVKRGTGTLTLSGTNQYTGTTTVSAGVIDVQNAAALGTAAGITTITTGAAVNIDGTGLTIAEPFTIAGTGIAAAGALRNLANNNAITGTITISTAPRINSDAGTLTLSAIAGTTATFTVGGAGNTTIGGAITTTTGGMTKDGAGTLLLNGAASYTGTTTITAGTLALGAADRISDSSAVSVAAAGTFDLTNGGAGNFNETVASIASAGGITLGSATLTLTGSTATTYSGSIAGTGTLTKTGTATLTMSGPNSLSTVNVNAGILTISGSNSLGTVNLNAGRINFNNNNAAGSAVINVANAVGIEFTSTNGAITLPNNVVLASGANSIVIYATSGNSLRQTGVISGGGSLLRNDTGAGTLTLAGTNTFTGGFTITSRDLVLGNASALGTGTFTVGDAVTAPANAISVSADTPLVGANAIGNAVILNQPLTIAGSTNSIEFKGVISGAGALTKGAASTHILSGSAANTYAGLTTINGGVLALNKTAGNAIAGNVAVGDTVGPGTLRLLAASQISDTSAISIRNGATFDVNSQSETLGVLSITGTTAGSAAIDFGSGTTSIVAFANSNAATWSGTTLLSILNWSGTPDSGGGSEQLIFGVDGTGLTSTQLSQIQFIDPAGQSGVFPAIILSNGEVVPTVPEPAAASLIALGAATGLLRRRRRVLC